MFQGLDFRFSSFSLFDLPTPMAFRAAANPFRFLACCKRFRSLPKMSHLNVIANLGRAVFDECE